MYPFPLVPDDFDVPAVLETDCIRLRPLTIHDVVKDFAAIMESEDRLREEFEPDNDWPSGLTLEQNLIDLGWHQREFQERSSFAFTVVDLDESCVLGCMYIYPTKEPGYDADISMWVRDSQVDTGLEEHLFETVKTWVEEKWPFVKPNYPSRSVSFED